MYKLMVVDDEYAIREGMMGYDWSLWGFEAAASASSGRRALEQMERTHIDLVITDIRMPGMDGLALAAEIKERYPDCVVVILSGYQDFDYAKAAIKVGVLDYLLKPVDMERSADIFARARTELDRRARRRSFLTHAAPIAIDTLVSNILHGRLVMNADVTRALEALDVSLEAPGYSVTCFSLPEDAPLDTVAAARALRESGGAYFVCFAVSVQHVFFVLNLIDGQGAREPRQHLTHQAGAQTKALHALLSPDAPVYVGVGDVVPALGDVERSRQQATQLARKARFAQDTALHTHWQSGQMRADYPAALAQAALEAIVLGSEAEATRLMPELMRALLLHYYTLPDTAFEALVDRFMREVDEALGAGAGWRSVDIPADYQAFLRHQPHFERISALLTEAAGALAALQAVRRADVTPAAFRAIQQTKRYIAAHFDRRITMAAMAGRAYMNSSYFSVLFKRETGKSFTDYLTHVRMEEAKRLLERADERIYEIGYRVGYPNPRYFSDAFRKYTGFSPQEYRERLQGGRDEGGPPAPREEG